MELNDIQQQILQPFVIETIKTLNTMAGLKAHAGDGFPDDIEKFKFKGYAVVAETSGNVEGKILMHHYVETALAIGNKVRCALLDDDQESPEMNEEVGEALAEFSNTAIGLAMRQLADSDLGIKFKPPYFVSDIKDMTNLMADVQEIVSVPIHVDDVGRFYFNFLLHKKTGNKQLPNSAKIMIVDDMKMVRSSIKSYLKQLGYENIIEAVDGQDAVEKHAMEEPAFIFMDIVMPNLNGNEALKVIRDVDKKVPIVMLTSVSDENLIKECEALGIKGYILKPLTREHGPGTLGQMLSLG